MNRMVIIIIGVVLLLVLLGAGFLLLPRLMGSSSSRGQQPAAAPTPIPTTQIVVLTQAVPRGRPIDETVLSLVTIPADLKITGMFTDFAEVVGRKAKFDLEAGIPLTSGMLVDLKGLLSATGSDWALAIPPGKVAITIPITRLSALAYAPQAGDHVDVMVTLMLVDIDQAFQSLLPNLTGGVVAPGDSIFRGGDQSTGSSTIGASQGNNDMGSQTQSTSRDITAQGQIETTASSLVAQISPRGVGAMQGRTELDPTLGTPLYVLPSEPQRPRIVTQSIIQNAIVLRVGTFANLDEYGNPVKETTVAAAEPAADAATGQTGEPTPVPEAKTTRPPDVITLIVSPQDAVTLNYLLYTGSQLMMVLRSAGDETQFVTDAVTLQFLLERYNIPVPAKLPYGLEPRLDKLVPPGLPNSTPMPTPQTKK